MNKKTICITGASRGIGRAIAHRFAKEGYHIIINCKHSKDALYELKSQLESLYPVTCLASVGDVGDEAYITQLFSQIENTYGTLDLLINNAGISMTGLLSDMSFQEWNHLINTNLSSVFLCSKAALGLMLPLKAGRILNISSVWGSTGASCEVAYSAAKGGVNAFTKALSKELAPSGISVNAIACGLIDTEMNTHLSKEEYAALAEEIPFGRPGTAEEVADLAYTLSSSSPYLTGQIVTLDGGWR